ncbi:type IV pilus assembly protein PilB [Roseimicrobium gellanilyticum]|uniref:Type IV pilus assembly protein PilB n=2 Tax=Roseimicrobium gellanilyticum TaxID=748857 RepID=A0A366H5P2_9BACT|nr:type IV pilus assembly protein PilB [Roseimicrobium gellanilyticum]
MLPTLPLMSAPAANTLQLQLHPQQSNRAGTGVTSSPVPGDVGVLTLEGSALQHGLVPVTLLRESCPPEPERVLRKLGRVPTTSDPWLPVSTVGPLLVMAHCNPRASDFWGVPHALVVRVLITREQYAQTREDFVQRCQRMPIPQANSLERLEIPRFSDGEMGAAFEWLLRHYPYDEADRIRLSGLYEEMRSKKENPLVSDFNAIQRNLGVALRYLVGDGRTYVFNAQEAPRQDMFPHHLLERHNVFPLYTGRQCIYLLSESQDNYAFEDEWHSLGNHTARVIYVLADPSSIREAIARAASSFNPEAVGQVDTKLAVADDDNIVEISAEDMARINPQSPNHTAEELVQWAIFTAIRCRASDLHLEKFYNMTRFRARIDGSLKVILTASEDLLPRFVAMVKNYSSMSQTRQEAQDGRFSVRVGTRRLDVRVAAVPTRRDFQKVIMRFLDKQDGVRRLSDFNLTQRQTDIFHRVMRRDQGLVLVTGPTGSGKTTTLYALLNSVNEVDVNIQTIEDPIEYEVEGINQTQTNPTYDLTFANGLRALLRADPDIILIGESRDTETAQAAVNASLTGHLVLTTLHANDSIRAVSRLLSMGVEKYLVADSLALSQAQRLVRRLCGYCKRPTAAPMELQEHLYRQGVISVPMTQPIHEKVGCSECHGTGYSGRVALMELCETTDELRDLIEQGAPQSAMRAAALKNGFRTLYQEGLNQVISGNTTIEEIRCLAYTAV